MVLFMNTKRCFADDVQMYTSLVAALANDVSSLGSHCAAAKVAAPEAGLQHSPANMGK